MWSYIGLRTTGALAVAGVFATTAMHGGWQSAAAAFTIAVGLVFLGCAIALGAMADAAGTSRPAVQRRRAPRRPQERVSHAARSPRERADRPGLRVGAPLMRGSSAAV